MPVVMQTYVNDYLHTSPLYSGNGRGTAAISFNATFILPWINSPGKIADTVAVHHVPEFDRPSLMYSQWHRVGCKVSLYTYGGRASPARICPSLTDNQYHRVGCKVKVRWPCITCRNWTVHRCKVNVLSPCIKCWNLSIADGQPVPPRLVAK